MLSEDIRQMAEYYGIENQTTVLLEECAELIHALSKYKRARAAGDTENAELYVDGIVNEIADVYIMLQQIEDLFNIENMVDEKIKEKVARQMNRIRQETKREWSSLSEAEILQTKRENCINCVYSKTSSGASEATCDYAYMTGHRRGCLPAECREKGIFKARRGRRRKRE